MSTERRTETIPEWKQTEVAAVADLVEGYDSVGVVDIAGIPSQQLQAMRRNLHGVAELRVSRNTLLVRALDDVDEGVEALADYVTGHVGLIGTDANPFTLFQRLEESKTAAPINAGEVAPNDIVIHAGDTGMDPGPFVGELQTVGAAARIDEGSIKVTEDSTVLEAGETVSADLANVLAELEIEPKEVGLDLRAVFADGVVFEPADLELDLDAYRRDVTSAVARGRNLALNGAIPTAATMPALVAMATGQAKHVAIQAGVEDPDVMPAIIGRADAQVRAIAGLIDDEDALPPALQDLAAPPASETAESSGDTQAEESSGDAETEEPAADDAEASDDETDDDEDDDGGGDALGAMFG